MSYRVQFEVKIEGINHYITIGECDANITYNVKKIIEESTGLKFKSITRLGYCKDIIPSIERGLQELTINPKKYKPFESENGWGTVEGTAYFFRRIISSWHDLCLQQPPEVLNVVLFSIS